jgi:hypothetical protein
MAAPSVAAVENCLPAGNLLALAKERLDWREGRQKSGKSETLIFPAQNERMNHRSPARRAQQDQLSLKR